MNDRLFNVALAGFTATSFVGAVIWAKTMRAEKIKRLEKEKGRQL